MKSTKFRTLLVLSVLLLTISIGTAMGKTPNPLGTSVDKHLSDYYGEPVATGPHGDTYWEIGDKWLNKDDFLNYCKDHQIHVPINFLVILGFVGFAGLTVLYQRRAEVSK